MESEVFGCREGLKASIDIPEKLGKEGGEKRGKIGI